VELSGVRRAGKNMPNCQTLTEWSTGKNDEEDIRFRTECTRSRSHSDLSVLIGYSLKYVGKLLRIVSHSQRSSPHSL
jgi:hypothetical protein